MNNYLYAKNPASKFGIGKHLNLETVDALNGFIERSNDVADNTMAILNRLFKRSKECLSIRLWNDATFLIGNTSQNQLMPTFTLVIHHPKVIRLLVFNSSPMLLADSYFRGDIDIEGDFFAAIKLKDSNLMDISWRDKLNVILKTLRLPSYHLNQFEDNRGFITNKALIFGNRLTAHSKSKNQAAIAFHYDISNAFYALWLDKSMVYSCAYFENKHDSLEQAQLAKLDHICKKLMLKPGDKFLDIGCGWGALLLHAAKYYGVIAHGVTLSRQQLTLARQRIAQAGLENRVTVDLCDYRDVKGNNCFDKIASIGMFEHVGLKNLPVYFSCIHKLLKPGGLFLNHGITHDVEGWQKTLSTEFINRYIFPDGQLDTVSNISRVMERTKFEIADCESLRAHYALTLRQWVARLEQRRAEALLTVNESTYRIWRLYMTACALEFEGGELGIYQILATKRSAGLTVLPLTRQHLYEGSKQVY